MNFNLSNIFSFTRKFSKISFKMKRANVNEIILSNINDLILEIKVKEITSENSTHQLMAMKFFQMALSVPSPDIKRILDLKIIPRIIELMLKRNDNLFHHYACWALINIATTKTTEGPDEIIKANGISALLETFDKCNLDVKILALWAMTNIIEDSHESRLKLISKGIIPRAIKILPLIPKNNFEGIQIVLWTLSNFNDSKFKQPLINHDIRECLKVFIVYFYSKNDEIKLEALKGISKISEDKNFNSEIIKHPKIIQNLVELLGSEKKYFNKEALRVIGNIAYTSTANLLYRHDIIIPLKNLLFVHDETILKEICWIFSNICADDQCFIDEVFDAEVFPRIFELLTHKDRKVRRESNYVVLNACKTGTFNHIKGLVVLDVLRQLTNVLDEKEDSEVVTTACETIYTILKKGECFFSDVNLFAILVDKYGGELSICGKKIIGNLKNL